MQFVRFAIVGVLVALSYIGLYLMFLALGVPQVLANAAAFLLAIMIQYIGQGRFTFGKTLRDRDQALRFVAMVGLGLLTAAIITGLIAPVTGLADWLAAAAVAVVLPIQNYIFMSNWVFKKPERGAEVSS